jgi:hypothetical protein
MDSGKYVLLDNKGNNYTCDLFGRQKPVFKKNISGFINGGQRKQLKELRRVKSHSNVIISETIKDAFHQKEKEEAKSYFPSVNRFEGYAPFPRPLCPPFTNIPKYVLEENYKRLLMNNYEQKLVVNENKKIFVKPNENVGLSYISSDIKGYLDKKNEKDNENNKYNYNIKKKDDKLIIIKMIDNTINEYKIKYKCNLNELIKNHSIIRALLHLKDNLINNNGTDLINGRKLKEPNIHIINEYKIIHNKLFNFNEQERIKKEHKRLMKCYSQMNIKNIKNKDNTINNNNNILGPKILNKINFNKNLDNKKAVIYSIKKDNENKEIAKDLFVNNNKGIINENKEENKSTINNSGSINYINTNQNLYDEQETKESLEQRIERLEMIINESTITRDEPKHEADATGIKDGEKPTDNTSIKPTV